MEIRLDRKRALVTGGSSGIGRAIAVALAAAGARVAINYRSHPEAAEEARRAVLSHSTEALVLRADVSSAASASDLFRAMDDAWGGIDILVNNAGIDGPRGLSWEIEEAAWRKVIEVNLFGAFYCGREALKRMVAQRSGVIINTSSVHEVIAWSGYSAYTASKAGLGMLSKTMAQEAAPYGVRVLAIAPGAIRTPINEAVWSNPDTMKDLAEKIPLRRIGEPEEVARLVVALASEVGSYVTGQTIFVDGGMTDYPGFAHGG